MAFFKVNGKRVIVSIVHIGKTLKAEVAGVVVSFQVRFEFL